MASGRIIYLDHNATTPVDPLVLEAMLPWFSERFGNAASLTHLPGHMAQRAVQEARSQVAALIGARPQELIFTSGATEANNLAILGVVRPFLGRKCHVMTQATEHPSVIEPFRELERLGASVTVLPVDRAGRISVSQLQAAMRPETALVSIMAANHETGVLQPIAEIGNACRKAGVLFHTDAAQFAGKLPIDVDAANIDLLSTSAHKIYGPKGAGALFIRARSPVVEFHPLTFGGQQERGLRPGTLNVPAIVGMGKAAELASERLAADSERLAQLRDRFEQRLQEQLAGVTVNGGAAVRLSHVSNVTFDHVESEALLHALDELAISSGAACSSASRQASPVLLAMGLDERSAFSTVRISFGRENTQEEADYAADRIAAAVTRLRALHPRAGT